VLSGTAHELAVYGTAREPLGGKALASLCCVQRELADQAGLSLISVQRAESGDALRLSTIQRLARALGIQPADLMAEPPTPRPSK
jgi:DNA-binding Xre family transcriptional regulator